MEKPQSPIQEDNSLNDFSSKISSCQKEIKNIETKTNQIMHLKNLVINSTDKEERLLAQKIDVISAEVIKSQNIVDKNIKEIKELININAFSNNEKIDLRIKQNLFNSMLLKYKNICLRFSKAESDIKHIIETKLVRAAEIAVNQELNDEQKRIAIENPQMIQQMYENKLTGAAHIKLQNAVRDLEERHRDIKKLEKSIIQVHNMIQELNALVQYQGEVIDNVEINIQKAKNYVFKAEKSINCKYRCMKCCNDLKLKCLCCGACCACCAACHCCEIF